MKEITMLKYTSEQIDQVLSLLTNIVNDSKTYECSIPMMAVVLDINNYLRSTAVVYEEAIEEESTDNTDITDEPIENDTGAE